MTRQDIVRAWNDKKHHSSLDRAELTDNDLQVATGGLGPLTGPVILGGYHIGRQFGECACKSNSPITYGETNRGY